MSATPDPSTWTLPRLRITRDGAWLHDDEEITHPGILGNLVSTLQVDAQGHFIEIGPVRVPVEVEAAPFVVVRVEREGAQLMLTLNDLSREPLVIDTLRFGADAAPYCRVKDGRFEARFDRGSTYHLYERVEYESASGTASLVLGGTRHPLPAPPEPRVE